MRPIWFPILAAAIAAAPAHKAVPYDAAADKLIEASHSAVAALPSFEIKQTLDQSVVILVGDKPTGPANSTKQVSTIEVDTMHGLVRLVTKLPDGTELFAIRSGKSVAMRIGGNPWEIPSGQFANIKD